MVHHGLQPLVHRCWSVGWSVVGRFWLRMTSNAGSTDHWVTSSLVPAPLDPLGDLPLVNTLDLIHLGYTTGGVRTEIYTFSAVRYQKPASSVVRIVKNQGPWRERPFTDTGPGAGGSRVARVVCGTVYPWVVYLPGMLPVRISHRRT